MIGLRGSPFLSGSEVEALKARTLTLDCRRMTLSKNATVAYQGAGSITQNEQGRLEFALFDPTTEVGFEFLHSLAQLPGTWQKLDDLYTLEAIDLSDRHWIARGVDASTSGRAGEPGTIVRGPLREIVARSERESKDAWLQLLFPGRPEILTTHVTEKSTTVDEQTLSGWERNLWIMETKWGRLMLNGGATHLEVSLTAQTPNLPEHFHERLEEVIMSMLATPLAYTLVQRSWGEHTETKIRSERGRGPEPRQGAPIWSNAVEATPDAADLFERLLGRVIETGDATKRHPLTLALRFALHAGAMSLDAEALVTATQVESLVLKCYSELAVESPSEIAEIDKAAKAIAGLGVEQDVAERLGRCVNQMKAPRAIRALRHLTVSGAVLEHQVKAWDRIRHRAAHGSLNISDVPETAAQCDAMFQLLWFLIFDQVGYTGRYTDYCTPGWPLRSRSS